MNELLTGLKDTLLIPGAVTNFDSTLKTYLLGAKSYVDSTLDNKPTSNDDLYNLTIIYLAQFYYLNRDNAKIRYLPITIQGLVNRLEIKYSN